MIEMLTIFCLLKSTKLTYVALWDVARLPFFVLVSGVAPDSFVFVRISAEIVVAYVRECVFVRLLFWPLLTLQSRNRLCFVSLIIFPIYTTLTLILTAWWKIYKWSHYLKIIVKMPLLSVLVSQKKTLLLFSSRPHSVGLVLPRMMVERGKPSFHSHSPGTTTERKSLHFCVLSSFQSFYHHSKPGRARTTKKTSFQARSPTLT